MPALTGGPASSGSRVPLVEELVRAPDRLRALACVSDLPYVVLLDSAADPERLGRFSFLTADPWSVVTAKDGRTTIRSLDGKTDASAEDPLIAVRHLLAPFASPPVPGIPPFQGGAAGYIGYDYGAWLERLPRPRYDDLDIPDVALGLYDWVIAWDHQRNQAWIVSTGAPAAEPSGRAARARARLEEVRRRLHRAETEPSRSPIVLAPVAPHLNASRPPTFPVVGHPDLSSSFSRSAYLAAVARVQEYILAGDIFQANLSQRFEGPLRTDPLTLYGRLRRLNPAPFAAYLTGPAHAIVSASPERFLRVDVDGAVETRPIKGTTPRGIGPEHDAHLGRALTESEKDRAENLMIVDLLRNDLSRICRPGSVRVPELFALEHYSTVHHLVSTVVGQLEAEADAIDLLRAAFPGGSITGAPKVRAMEIIAELEPSRRGVYCGAIGYLSHTGAADTSIVIRSYLLRHDRAYFSAGGGIVSDSEPAAEYDETLDKARALIAAFEADDVAAAATLT
jgi:para-aminobenzoate synthetase component I